MNSLPLTFLKHVILNKKVSWGMSLSCSCEMLGPFKNVLTVHALYLRMRYTWALTWMDWSGSL